MIAYVYKWTHKPTLNWYVGSRTAKGCYPSDGYICSSKIVRPLIKDSPNEWERTIVATGTVEEILELEMEILQLFDAQKDPRSFNRSNVSMPCGVLGIPKTIEHKEKLRQLNLGKRHTQDSIVKMKAKRANQIMIPGWHWSDESRANIKGKPKLRGSCVFCKKESPVPHLSRWHNQCR